MMIALVLIWSIQATLVGLFSLLLIRIARHWSPRLRHAIVLVALVAFLVPPMLSLPGVPTLVQGISALMPAVAAGEAPAAAVISGRTFELVFIVWLVGFALVGSLIAFQVLFLEHLRRGSERVVAEEVQGLVERIATGMGIDAPALLVSSKVTTPLVTGVLRPAILLPRSVVASCTPRAMAQLITHELAHLRQRDLWLNWLRALACALWWPHPLVWWLARASRALREECCDDVVLTELEAPAHEYARTLLSLAERPRPALGTALALGVRDGSRSALRSRLERLGDPAARRTSRLGRAQLAAVAAFAIFVLNGALMSQPARTSVGDNGDETVYIHLSGDDETTWRKRGHRHAHSRGHWH